MKKLILLIVSSVMLFASVGEMIAVKGEVKILRDNKEIIAKNGMEVEKKDVVQTSNRAKAQIMFKDETVIRIGKSTIFKIEDYKFDGSKDSKADLKVSKGFFKAITGKIGKVARDNFKLKTKTATCGIRGTHFMGSIEDEAETIACTKGAITVEAQGKTVDVLAGEMTEFKSGMPPSIPKKIKEDQFEKFSSLSRMNKIDLETMKQDFNEDRLNKEYDVLLGDKIQFESDSSRVKWGFFTASDKSKVITKVDGKYIVDSNSFDTLLDAINSTLEDSKQIVITDEGYKVDEETYDFLFPDAIKASGSEYVYSVDLAREMLVGNSNIVERLKNEVFITKDEYDNIEVWREGKETSWQIIADKMGGSASSSEPIIANSWDGSVEAKKVAKYEGNYLGSVKYDKGYAIVEQDSVNKVNFTLDFGNRFLFGNLNFNVKKMDNSIENWSVDMASIGSYTINPTSFYVDNYGFWGNEGFAGADIFYNRYFGEDGESISGYFQGLKNFDPELRDEYDEIVFGVFSADRVEEVILTKQELGNDEYFSYGLWAKDDLSMGEVLNTMAMGAWIDSKEAVTSTDVINEYIASGVKATYNGEVFGTVHYPIEGRDTEMMKNGNIALNIDFGKANMDGKIGFEAGNEPWNIDIHSGIVNQNGFDFGGFSGNVGSAGEVVDYLEGNGKFYGTEAGRIGGGFQAGSTGGKFAIGAFKAKQ